MTTLFFVTLWFLLSLAWGSFLCASAYRIAFDKKFLRSRSHCPTCDHIIPWYANIPVFSWLLLRGKCLHCSAPISYVYPFIELLSGVVFTGLLIQISQLTQTWPLLALETHQISELVIYSLFFSCLIFSSATDLFAMVIPQAVTLWLIPVGVALAYSTMLPISGAASIVGAVAGYGCLWLTATIFRAVKRKEGMGVGDMELLGFIGAFLGPLGVWVALMVGSFAGIIFGNFYLMLAHKNRATRIPFGPFLSLGAIVFYFFKDSLVRLFF
ncbi:prepilin peptidase [Candidatus Babeliales bacterium]|nr:prepilin peptidase [Candidatus Babeliales bacterium]